MLNSARFVIVVCCLTLALKQAGATTPPVEPSQKDGAGVQVLSVGQMTPADAQVLEAHRSQVNTAAQFHGYDLQAGTWIQSQVACPYAPRFLIMHNVQLNHDGFVSLFTALIPRDGSQVRVIPVLHHGAQALQIFGASPEQRSLIDQVISAPVPSQGPDRSGDWLTLAYCYGALAGAEPAPAGATEPDRTVPRLGLNQDGSVRDVSFSVFGPDQFYQDWTVEFGGHGHVNAIRLSMRAAHEPQKVVEVPRRSGRPVPAGTPVRVQPIPRQR